MSELRSLILAVTLSMLVLFSWQYFVQGPKREQQEHAITLKQQTLKQQQVLKQVEEANKFKTRENALQEGGRVKIASDFVHGSINLKGARFDDLTLAQFHETVDPKSPEVVLLAPSATKQVYFAEFGWIANKEGIAVPDSNTVWKSEGTTLSVGKPVKLTWDSPQGLRFVVNIALDEHYMFTITQSVENHGASAVSLSPYGLINRTRGTFKPYYISHEGAVGVLDGVLHEVTYAHLTEEKEKYDFPGVKGWIGIGDKYWLTALIPPSGETYDARFSHNVKNDIPRFQVDFTGTPVQVAPGGNVDVVNHFYAGAKKVGILEGYAKSLGITHFDRAVDFGWLYFITKPFFHLLNFYFGLVGSFGIAILLLTITIKGIMFPVANKGYRSMNQLKAYQPEILRMRENFKDDRVRMNQELMDFYKRNKISPLSGCLPILIQIPIFFALYKVLFVTIEMRHTPFYGWIHDMSAPDPTSVLNLFGLLPFSTPAALTIGAWPLMMGITMYIQQRLNPPPTDQVQASVMRMMPFIMVFIFSSFPAGLVIYWTWSNILSIIQQRLIAGGLKRQQLKKVS
ncbi:MAG: membrane protein insertase YidC [Proteobacteria bacterium]|nr:membrane protein insertase YidC [Pseudomonadota bacterium]